MKKLVLFLFLLIRLSIVNAQIKEGFNIGIGTIFANNNISGNFELGEPLEPIGDRGAFNLVDNGFGVKGLLGYSRIINKFYIGGEFSVDYISSQNKSKRNGNWNFSIRNGLGFDLAILSGLLLRENYLLYGKVGLVPYSRYIISAEHDFQGGWEDHNFIGFNIGIGNRINIGFVDLKIEIKNCRLNFNQSLKDGALSSQKVNQWDFEIGIIKTFTRKK